MAYKPSVPKGTRDFTPEILEKRLHILDTIRDVYELFGYVPIETPAMELMDTLTGKYGSEGDKLLFKILNSGDFLTGVDNDLLRNPQSTKLSPLIAEKGLRYDLTVPFARYVVQHRNEITLPFKRYQIQPVWRADKPQKGRYREFFQCDADVIGSNSLINEIELVQIIDKVFGRLRVNVSIRLNNRKILYGMAEVAGVKSRFQEFTIILDKFDKFGHVKVLEELRVFGVQKKSLNEIEQLFAAGVDNNLKISQVSEIISGSETGQKGIEEMRQLLKYHSETGTTNPVEFDLTLARGLNYYTGTIFEVVASDVNIGSVCGGGRYDDLTGIFGMSGLSGVGISFGADRIYDVMEELNLFAEVKSKKPVVLFINFGGDDEIYSLKALCELRDRGIGAELYPDAAKVKKQMAYADARKIPFVVLAGEQERSEGLFTMKNMQTGEQEKAGLEEIFINVKEYHT